MIYEILDESAGDIRGVRLLYLGHIVRVLKVVQEGCAVESQLGHLLEALYEHFDIFHNTVDTQHENTICILVGLA